MPSLGNALIYLVMPYRFFLALWLLFTPFVFGLATYMSRYLLGLITASMYQETDLLTYAYWATASVLGVLLTGIYLLTVPLVVVLIETRVRNVLDGEI